MNPHYDYRKYSVLYVDDEQQTADNFKDYFSDTFDVVVATSAEEGWEIFKESPDKFAVVMTDQRMPGTSGVELLERVKAERPRVLRILATAYSDLDAAISAVNTGAIYKYVTKPWDPPTLEMNLMRGMEFFLVQRERDLLLREKMASVQRLMMTDRLISLGIFAAGINHHLRNSLTAVKTFIDLAPFQLQSENVNLDALKNPGYWKDFYQTVQEQVQKITGLLAEIQEIPQPPKMPLTDRVDISKVVKEEVEAYASKLASKNVKIHYSGVETPPITGNIRLLKRAISLLLDDENINVPEGGSVEVSVKPGENISGVAGVKIEVSDDGPGLNQSNLTCVFDPFFVRQNFPEQYGLNLLACFFLIYHHSGTISVQQAPKGGAFFEIWLPHNPGDVVGPEDQDEFLQRVLSVERVWEKMLLSN